MRRKMCSRWLAALLAVAMCLSLTPGMALAADADHVVISQAYGGGGNSGAKYKNDFIELHNPTDQDVSLDGWSVQYTSKEGTSFQVTPLSGTVKAKGFYLIQESAGTGGTEELPTPDATGTISMAGKEFKVALVNATTAISGKSDASVVDFLGVGGANEYEGTAAAPIISNTTAASRKVDGVDTDDNAADFQAAEPNPRNSAYNAGSVTQVSKPVATPSSGSSVEAASTVTLTCATADVTFQRSADGQADWTNLGGNTFTLPADAWDGDYTVYIKAIHATLDDSDVVTLKYKYKAPAQEVSIAQARAAASGDFTVTGVIVFIDGSNVVIQDSTGGINLYCSAKPTGLAVGDVVKGTGTRGEYKGLIQLSKATAEKVSDTVTLPESPTVAIANIGESYESQKIKVVDAKVTDINGTTVTLSQGEGGDMATITIFKCPTKENLTIGDTITVTAVVSQFDAYQLRVVSADDIDITDDTTPVDPPEPPKEFYKPANGDVVAFYNPNSNLALTAAASGSRLKGAAVEIAGDSLFSDGSVLALTATVDADGNYTFTSADGKVLNTGATGNNLTLAEPAAATAAKWKLENSDNGWLVHSVEANYNGNYNQYIECYQGNFTVYGKKDTDTDDLFATLFYKNLRTTAQTDPNVEDAIASWGGALKAYDNADTVTSINGDRFRSGDELDAASTYTVSKGGAPAMVLAASTKPNYYMGATGLKADDYLQFRTSSKGWGDMTLSFRLRVTASAAGSWQLQYSINGTDFSNFTTGSYSYAYTSYVNGESVPVSGSGSVTDGTAPTSKAPAQYIEFTFDVPAPADDAETLYIRLVSGNKKASGAEGDASGNIRIDSVVLSGHPVVSDAVAGFVTVEPDGREEDVPAGTALTMTSATENAVISYRFGGTGDFQTYSDAAKPTLPAPLPTTLEVYATAPGKTQSVTRIFNYAAGTVEAVRFSPNGGGIIFKEGEDSKTVTLTCATEGAVIWYALDNAEEFTQYDPAAPIPLQKGFGTKTIRAYATLEGFSDSPLASRTFTQRETERYQLYFGQLHSHTSYSDGAGTAQEAFSHAKGLNHDQWNLDFLAVTDHSNSFDDASGVKRLADAPTGSEWNEGKALAKAATDDSFVGIFGYEMTWSNGLGHINTFNTPGYQARTQAEYSTYSTALQNYYAELKTVPTSLSQFNHPGTTFGDFSDFAHYDEEIDQLITMVEVGNGEGAIGSSGYFPSYEYYTRALDKGWHVAPSNNQDNHKGGWGDSNTGRDVVLVDELTEEAIYDAMRNYRMYATEDLNLGIYYTFDGQLMGSILEAGSYAAGSTVKIKVELSDADTVAGRGDAGEATVQVIGNGGAVVAETKASCDQTVEIDVPTTYSYYYIKVTQADGDIAVTAPVWVGKVEAVGITSLKAASDLTVTGQEQTFTLELFNNEKKPLEITSIVFTDDEGTVLHTAVDVASVPKLGTAATSFTHTFSNNGMVTITATVKGTLNGVEKTYTQKLELSVMPKEIVKRVIVDGTHFNDYVTGYYGGNFNNAASIAAGVGVEVVVEKTAITAEMLEDCELLVIPAPAKKAGTANAGDYTPSQFEPDFLTLVANYVQAGGKVVVCGLADYQDGGKDTEFQTSVQQNKLLAAIGSTMKINDDEVIDNEHNGGQPFRLYPEVFSATSPWTKGLVTKASVAEGESYQTYSQYSGCSVNPGEGEALVMGFETTWGGDSDKDGKDVLEGKSYTYQYNGKDTTLNAVVDMGDVVFLAAESVGQGTVFAAGGVFLSDFEVKAELDNIWDLPYANRTIFENILTAVRAEVPVTPIADTRTAELNNIFVVEGYVTNGTTDPNTTFFDAIYVQDDTGGTTAFPYSNPGLAIGTKVRILGYTDAYQGDREIQIITLEVLDDQPKEYQPKALSTKDAMDYETYGGQLVSTSGTVSDIIQANGIVSQFKLTDEETGVAATIFIDGYITNAAGRNTIASWLQNGRRVSATGLLYLHPEGDSDVSVPVLRVRDCDEVVWLDRPSPVRPRPSTPDVTPASPLPFVDVADGDWYYAAVADLHSRGLLQGTDETHFTPNVPLTRGAAATLLYRLEQQPGTGSLTSFPDVETGSWYTDGVCWAQENGVVNGYTDGRFGPNDPVTREQMVAILYRYAQFKGYAWNAPAGLDAFTDADRVSPYAAEAMSWAVANGLIQGVGGGRLAPSAVATRAEIAALLSRFLSHTIPTDPSQK